MTTARSQLAPLLLLSGIYVLVALLTGNGPVDDSLIFLRYARNALHGLGIVFNPGERVEGYTSPLWLACVTAVTALSRNPADIVPYVSGAIGLVSVLVISRRSLVAALAVAINPAYTFWSFSGMENALTGLTLAVTAVALSDNQIAQRRSVVAGLAFSLGCLSRPETVVLAPILALWLAHQSPQQVRIRRVVGFVLPLVLVLVHLLWRKYYYGHWVPNTAFAKAGIGIATLVGPGVAYLPKMWIWWAVIIGGAAAEKRLIVLAGAVAVGWSLVVICIGGDFFPFARFGVALIPFLAVLICRPVPGKAWLSGMAVVAASLSCLAITDDRDRGLYELRLARGWRESGIWLSQNLPPQATVATLVAGCVPYFSQRPTIDILGLTDSHIARYGKIDRSAHVGHQRFDTEYVLARQPDVIVLQDSGQSPWPRFGIQGWPVFSGEELRYVQAMDDLVRHPLTRMRYAYRAVRLPDGTYLEALWRSR